MRKEYDFSKSRKNPYAKQLKRQITIRLDTMAVTYFKELAAELGTLMADSSPKVRTAIQQKVIPRLLSFGFLLRQYFKRESLDEMLTSVKSEFAAGAKAMPDAEKGAMTKAIEIAATMRRVDALVYMHQLLKLWLAPHVLVTSLMLALMIVHIIQVIYFLAR